MSPMKIAERRQDNDEAVDEARDTDEAVDKALLLQPLWPSKVAEPVETMMIKL